MHVDSFMFLFVLMCTESFRQQYVQMLQVMATSQYRDQILAEIKLQSVSVIFFNKLCCCDFSSF